MEYKYKLVLAPVRVCVSETSQETLEGISV